METIPTTCLSSFRQWQSATSIDGAILLLNSHCKNLHFSLNLKLIKQKTDSEKILSDFFELFIESHEKRKWDCEGLSLSKFNFSKQNFSSLIKIVSNESCHLSSLKLDLIKNEFYSSIIDIIIASSANKTLKEFHFPFSFFSEENILNIIHSLEENRNILVLTFGGTILSDEAAILLNRLLTENNKLFLKKAEIQTSTFDDEFLQPAPQKLKFGGFMNSFMRKENPRNSKISDKSIKTNKTMSSDNPLFSTL